MNELNHPRWLTKWNAGIAVGAFWDTGTPSPLLVKYIEEGKVPEGRALVPGCGRGYDVAALASEKRLAIGLDISEVAVQTARDYISSLPKEQCLNEENAVVECKSYFDMNVEDPAELFDFIYDYTFLCALDPSVRVEWAKQTAKLLRQGGELITLIFPIRGQDNLGPPFSVSMEGVRDLLEPVGFECLELELLPPELCHRDRDGSAHTDPRFNGARTAVGRWKKIFSNNYF